MDRMVGMLNRLEKEIQVTRKEIRTMNRNFREVEKNFQFYRKSVENLIRREINDVTKPERS